MSSPKFNHLTDLVLTDILAALPMPQVMRVTRVGSPRLRRICSRRWVTARMTDVTFRAAAAACVAGSDEEEVFCERSVLKRLYGKVLVKVADDFDDPAYVRACVALANKVPGKLNVCVIWPENIGRFFETQMFLLKCFHYSFMNNLSGDVRYIMSIGTSLHFDVWPAFPNLVCEYGYERYDHQHNALYKPEKLNERNVIDVLRAVYGPADVDQRKLGLARRKAASPISKEGSCYPANTRYSEWAGFMVALPDCVHEEVSTYGYRNITR